MNNNLPNQNVTMAKHHRLIILGSGPAGCTAAIYAARANLKPTMITGNELGGQIVRTTQVDNWPGDPDGIDGYSLMERMQRHVERFSAEVITDQITSVDLKQRPFLLKSDLNSYTCDALIIATGAVPKKLGIPAEQQYLGQGVSTCATCDGYFYKGKVVAVVGGGNTALEDALYLANLAKKVILIHRRDTFRADSILVNELCQLEREGKVEILRQHIISDILGDTQGVNGIMVKNIAPLNSANSSINSTMDHINHHPQSIAVDGVFIAIGLQPNNDLFIDQLEMEDGYIKIKHGTNGNFTATSIPGIFAAGDIVNGVYRQVITAAGMGCTAALDAQKYLL